MSQYLISICVQTASQVDRDRIAREVVGKYGQLRGNIEPQRFWARTALTLRQVRAIQGVKDCRLCPVTW